MSHELENGQPDDCWWQENAHLREQLEAAQRELLDAGVAARFNLQRAEAAEILRDTNWQLFLDERTRREDAEAEAEKLRAALEGLLEQIEIEIGPCDGVENSALWPTANEARAALASTPREEPVP